MDTAQKGNEQENTQKKNKPSKSVMVLIVLSALLFISMVANAYMAYVIINKEDVVATKITNYNECINAGYEPLVETYPTQCKTPEGTTFTQEITVEENSIQPTVNQPVITSKNVKVLDNPIFLKNSGDEKQLAGIAPQSFIEYMANTLNGNKPDEYGCILGINIIGISELNVSAGVGGVAPDSNPNATCGGAYKAYYYIDNGVWMEFGMQELPACTELATRKIYSEFIGGCYNEDYSKELENPNGSIDAVLGA